MEQATYGSHAYICRFVSILKDQIWELQLSTMKGLALLAQYISHCITRCTCSVANHEVGSDPTPATAGLSVYIY